MDAVITYIFGKDKEVLREPLTVDDGVEYICVTDQKNLQSNVWKIKYDAMHEVSCLRDKMVYVKYNPFKYTNADRICVIDGTLQITKSLKPFFNKLSTSEMLIKLHPQRNNLYDELQAWEHIRGTDESIRLKYMVMADCDGINLDNNFLVESCIVGYSKTKHVLKLCYRILQYMRFLGDNNKFADSNQCVLTYLLQKHTIILDIINQSSYATRYKHGTWQLADR